MKQSTQHLIQDGPAWLVLCAVIGAITLWPSGALHAQTSDNPVGLWQSIDDAAGKPRAQIRIAQSANVLTGRIVASSMPVPAGAVLRCELCTDDRKNQALIGMEIIRNMRPTADGTAWAGGEILDPDTGKTYRLQLMVQDNGKKLQVRGYIGPFFRNQTWQRLE